MESTFSNEQLVALAKLIDSKESKEASANLAVGDHVVDFVLRVNGSFKKGADYTQRFVAKADAWGLLAVALSKLNGVTVESLVREHLDQDEDTKKQIKAKADAALQKIKSSTIGTANGKVTSVKLAGEEIPVVTIDDLDSAKPGRVAVEVA